MQSKILHLKCALYLHIGIKSEVIRRITKGEVVFREFTFASIKRHLVASKEVVVPRADGASHKLHSAFFFPRTVFFRDNFSQ